MCGIGGIYKMGNQAILSEEVSVLLCSLEHRGIDASGIAIGNDAGEVQILKNDEPAWKFITADETKTFLESYLPMARVVLVHTRHATQGSPSKNINNHPLTNGLSVVVHNGMISNDNHLFGQENLTRVAETDSDILRGIADQHGIEKNSIEVFQRVSGSVAAGILHPEFPRKVLLLRSGSPLVVGTSRRFIYWASEKNCIHVSGRPWRQRWGLWVQSSRSNLDFSPVPADTAWMIGPEGLEWHLPFKTASFYREPNRKVYENYQIRKQKHLSKDQTSKVIDLSASARGKDSMDSQAQTEPESEPKSVVLLPFCGVCHKSYSVPENALDVPIKKLWCPTCRGSLHYPTEAELKFHKTTGA